MAPNEEPFLLELEERLADRRPADTKRGRQLDLGRELNAVRKPPSRIRSRTSSRTRDASFAWPINVTFVWALCRTPVSTARRMRYNV